MAMGLARRLNATTLTPQLEGLTRLDPDCMYRDTVGHEPNIHVMGAKESRGEAWRASCWSLLDSVRRRLGRIREDLGGLGLREPESRLG
jgi:hypothetical protein